VWRGVVCCGVVVARSRYGFFVANYGGLMEVHPSSPTTALLSLYPFPRASSPERPTGRALRSRPPPCGLVVQRALAPTPLTRPPSIPCARGAQLFELTEGLVADVAREAGLATYPTAARLVSLPLVSHSAMDIFAGNEVSPAGGQP